MIIGVGVDIIEIERIEKAAAKAAFLRKVFSDNEIALFNERRNAGVLAGCFAGKEAVAKAMGTGFSGFWPRDIEILRDDKGAPHTVLHGKARDTAAALDINRWHISLSNTKDHAVAVAVAES